MTRRDEWMDRAKEIREAKLVALRVLEYLDKAEQKLNSARRWGILDILGGEFLTSLIKHSKMDDAERLLEQIRYDLRTLRNELNDIDIQFGEQIGVSSFGKFMDIVFDNIVSDWLTQSKIKQSLQEIDRIRSAVRDVLKTLNRMESEL